MPSVMTTARPISASIASTTASLVNFGGTKITLTSAPVAFIPSATEPKTGTSVPSKSTFCPALRGFTPPTIWVPEASMRRVCLVPSEPVMPWTSTLLSLFRKIAMVFRPLLRRELGGLSGGAVHRVDLLHGRVGALGEDLTPEFGVVAVKAYDQRLADVVATLLQQVQGLDDTVRDGVTGGDATEDVDEHALDRRVPEDDLETVGHHLGGGATTDVEEVGGFDTTVVLTGVGHHVQGGHDQTGTVTDDADLTVEFDVVEALGLGLELEWVAFLRNGEAFQVLTEVGVLVQGDLAVQGDDTAVLGQDERVDLDERGVLAHEGVPQLGDDLGGTLGSGLRQLACLHDLGRDVRGSAGQRIDRDLRDGVGVGFCDLLDVHAALGGADGKEGAVGAVQQEGEVVLLRDVGSLFDQHAVDRVSLDVHAEDLLGLGLGVVSTVGDLHTACLAAAAGLDLRLDDDAGFSGGSELLSDRTCLSGRARHLPLGYGDPVLCEELLRLVFEQVHEGPSL